MAHGPPPWTFFLENRSWQETRVIKEFDKYEYSCPAPGNGSSFDCISFRAMGNLVPPLSPHLYTASFSLQVYAAASMGVFLALRYENRAVQASVRLLAPALGRTIHVICMPSSVRVMCAFEYVSINHNAPLLFSVLGIYIRSFGLGLTLLRGQNHKTPNRIPNPLSSSPSSEMESP